MVSLAIIALELLLMRALSFRFWHTFAAMVISVALLGFGAGGAFLTVFRKFFLKNRINSLFFLALTFSLSIPFSFYLTQMIPFDLYRLAWSPSDQLPYILLAEFSMLLPFLFGGGVIGLSLMDQPKFIGGHYAANLGGSGAGSILLIILMWVLPVGKLISLFALIAFAAAVIIIPTGKRKWIITVLIGGLLLLFQLIIIPPRPVLSEYKKLFMERNKPDVKTLYRLPGPAGRIDVLKGPSIHDAPPGMSLKNPHEIPDRMIMIINGSETNILYKVYSSEKWAFTDYTLGASVFHLGTFKKALILKAGGGAAIGRARFHHVGKITALQSNPGISRLITGPLSQFVGEVYSLDGVDIITRDARGFLESTDERFDLIQIPMMEPGGAAGAGSSFENYVFTVEALKRMLKTVNQYGFVVMTVEAKTPPRNGIRLFDLAVQSLKSLDLDPEERLAMMRSWETVTVVMKKEKFKDSDILNLRNFCDKRSFDLAYLPGLKSEEVNRYHRLPSPWYYEGASALLGADRKDYLERYVFDIKAATDNKPYFFQFLKWDKISALRQKIRGQTPAFLELGSLLQAVALAQSFVLAFIFIIFPLLPLKGFVAGTAKKAPVLLYFLLLGLGFMILEMGFLQKLILYLSLPIYSAASVIAFFLIFAGVGSRICHLWEEKFGITPGLVIGLNGIVLILVSLLYIFFLDSIFSLLQFDRIEFRFLVSGILIAPLAFAMGHFFPMGLSQAGKESMSLIPWAWAANGFASVIATVATPLVAMLIGFNLLISISLICYLTASILFCTILAKRQPAKAT